MKCMTKQEKKPSNPKDKLGVNKVPFDLVPGTALAYQAMAHLHGAMKYGKYNWRDAGVRTSIYIAAALRHLQAKWNGEDLDPDSGLPHEAHVIACMNIVLDAMECGKLNDDRPTKAPVPALLKKLNAVVAEWNAKHEKGK